MTADDKRLLRKFINQRAESTRTALRAAARRKEQEATRGLKLEELSSDQLTAVQNWNLALAHLADAANLLRKHGLDYRSNGYYRRGDIAVATADSFNESCLTKEVPRLESVKEEATGKIREQLNRAISDLDRTVDAALLDMLSADLPGIKETLQKLGETFDKVAADFGVNSQDYS